MASKSRTPADDRDDFFDVGVRATVANPLPQVWEFLVGEGLPLWLGEVELPTEQNAGYATADGVRGVIYRYVVDSGVKLTWRPKDWPHNTTLTVLVKKADAGTTVSIKQDGLADREERRMMLGHWKSVIADLVGALEKPAEA